MHPMLKMLCNTFTRALLHLSMTHTTHAHTHTHTHSQRFLRNVRVPRQSMAVCESGNNTGCLPEGTTSAPDSLVNCVAGELECLQHCVCVHLCGVCDSIPSICSPGECVCTDCFLPDDDTGKCRLCPDYSYSPTQELCANDRRQRQLTALLLSVFLSGVGAANFYIDQNSLGK